jgi:hypothetical protein
MPEANNQLKKYQLQWRPTFPFTPAGETGVRMYVFGDRKVYTGQNYDSLSEQGALDPQSAQIESIFDDPNVFTLPDIIKLAQSTTLILPFNTGVALAQEYSPQINNKIVPYETLGGNSVTTFGQGIRRIGLQVRIIKAGRNWETYYKGLEALSYLSGNQGRYPGSLYLLGYDMFSDGTQNLVGRYKVAINNLDLTQRSSENTSVSGSLDMTVIHDYGQYQSQKRRVWGAL